VVLAVDVVLVGGVAPLWLAVWLAVAGLVVMVRWRNRAGRVAGVASGAGLASTRDLIQAWTSLSTKAIALPVNLTAGGKSPLACNS
jgi:hypothetical protein